MEYLILKQADQVLAYVAQVSNIADQNKNSFGFLSASAYEQMASKGQLWVATDKMGELKGYLMFGGTMPTLKVFQIYVCRSTKGHRLGRQLIGSLKEYAEKQYYHSISARVASDLPANGFWDAVGFTIFRQVKGSGKTKRTINIRGYSLEGNDLFGKLAKETGGLKPIGPVLHQPIYALDLNLLLEVSKARPDHKKVVKIMRMGFEGKYSICITPEFKNELERQSANFPSDPVLRLAHAFPELTSKKDVTAAADALRGIVFPYRTPSSKSAKNDESDLMHLAYCITAGIDGFITREKALLRACNQVKDKYGVAILSPDELVFEDSEQQSVPAPLNSDFSLSESLVTDEIIKFIEGFSAPSTITSLLNCNPTFKDSTRVYQAKLNGNLFGVYFFQKPVKATGSALAALYVDENSPKATATTDHFLETALRYKCGFPYRLDFYIGKDQASTQDTLLKKGFIRLENHFVKIISNMFLDAKNWPRFSKDLNKICGFSIPESLPSKKTLKNTGIFFKDSNGKSQTFSWFEFETVIGPRFIMDYDRCCTLVPIREHYANGLIGNIKNQISLLSTHDKVFLLEKAYFRSCTKSSLFTKGGIIAFYVSGSKSIQELIGFARITYSDVITIDEAVVKVDRQGVLSSDELLAIADKNEKIHVFTFDNFLEFDNRISFSKAKDLKLISRANLVSPEKISIEKLRTLIGVAFNE